MVEGDIMKTAAEHIRRQNDSLRRARILCAGLAGLLALIPAVLLAVHKKRKKLRE